MLSIDYTKTKMTCIRNVCELKMNILCAVYAPTKDCFFALSVEKNTELCYNKNNKIFIAKGFYHE